VSGDLQGGSGYLVLGLGVAGLAAAATLLRDPAGRRVVIWDAADTSATRARARRLRGRGAEVHLGDAGAQLVDRDWNAIVKSPGIPSDVPLLCHARARGIEVIDELELAWRRCRQPVVGVTGTNGKSTTCALLAGVLRAAGSEVHVAGNTEFGPPLSAAPRTGWIVCEASSFQLEAAPTFQPSVAVFTNLTPEHLDRHGSMARYGAAKRTMFLGAKATAGRSIVNLDDAFGRQLAQALTAAGAEVVTYGFDPEADVRLAEATWDMRSARLRVNTRWGDLDVRTRLPGHHNARNTVASIAAGLSWGIGPEEIADAVAFVAPPPGRWVTIAEGQPFDVLVDYAHTPDGLDQVLRAIRSVLRARGCGRLRAVFGAVGLRDPSKARASARVLAHLSDHLILTTGSAPRDHRILRLRELARAARNAARMELVLDRPAAIARALAAAHPGDVVAVLGLGALRRQVLDATGATRSHSDADAVRACLQQLRDPAACA
jgi:UDP-N-acetylmuramoyl-L-alanyl-D-glutamate--2,6-diaminopimelate ligase